MIHTMPRVCGGAGKSNVPSVGSTTFIHDVIKIFEELKKEEKKSLKMSE